MHVKRYQDGRVKIHMDDEDRYEVTDNNGLDIWLTPFQAQVVKKVIS